MAVGALGSIPGVFGIAVTKKRPGHFVALTEDGRVDAVLNQGGKLAEILERRAAISVRDTARGPADGSFMKLTNLKTLDPYDVAVAMPAADGEPVVSDADRDAWSRWRVSYPVILQVGSFEISGTLMLLPSQDLSTLMERGTELFLPVLKPTVLVNGLVVKDVPRDAVLVNRSHISRVSEARRR